MKKYKLEDLVSSGTHARSKIKSDVIIGDANGGYGPGDILDANAVVQLIRTAVASGIAGLPQTISSDNIENGSILLEDMSLEVLDKLTHTYEEGDESFSI